MKTRAEVQHDYYERNKERLKENQKRHYAEKHKEILAKKRGMYKNVRFSLFIMAKYNGGEKQLSIACRKHKYILESRGKQLLETGAFNSYSINPVIGDCQYCEAN